MMDNSMCSNDGSLPFRACFLHAHVVCTVLHNVIKSFLKLDFQKFVPMKCVNPKLDFSIGNRNQGPILVSVLEQIFLIPK